MSIILNMGTTPPDLWVKCMPDGTVDIGEYNLSPEDMIAVCFYFLTNSDLGAEDDPRRQFVKCVKTMEEHPGWNHHTNPKARRLWSSVPPAV